MSITACNLSVSPVPGEQMQNSRPWQRKGSGCLGASTTSTPTTLQTSTRVTGYSVSYAYTDISYNYTIKTFNFKLIFIILKILDVHINQCHFNVRSISFRSKIPLLSGTSDVLSIYSSIWNIMYNMMAVTLTACMIDYMLRRHNVQFVALTYWRYW